MKFKFYIILLVVLSTTRFVEANPYPGTHFLTYIHTDRFCYVSGDNILLKGYHFNIKPNNNSVEMALYVDISTVDSLFIKGEMFRLKNGVTSGVLNIPDSLKTGEYIVRAYTSHSLKYNKQEVLYSKNIYVTNRFGNNGVSYESDIEKQNKIFKNQKQKIEVESDFVKVEFDDTIYSRRSKIKASIQLYKASFLKASLTIKPISAYESYYASRNKNITSLQSIFTQVAPEDSDLQLIESKGIVVSGQVLDKQSLEPLKDVVVFVAEQGESLNFRTAISDENGNFCFLFHQFYNYKDVYLSCYSLDKFEFLPNAKVIFDSKFLGNSNASVNLVDEDNYEKSYDTLNLQKSIINKAYNLSFLKPTEKSLVTNVSYEELYFIDKYDYAVNTDEYVELNDFMEISREILPLVKIRKNKNGYECSIADGTSNIVRDNPLVLVDGVPLNNLEDIIDWGTKKIQKIAIKVEPRYYGDIVFVNGIIVVWTRDNDFWKKKDYAIENKYTFQGFQPPASFKFPDYSIKNNKSKPDFRQLQYWNADVNIDNGEPLEFEFFTSDETGLFECVIEGVVDKGKPIFVRKLIYVE